MNLGGSLDLQVDPADAERRKRARIVHINVLVVPRLRLLGFILVAAAALLHNLLIYPGWNVFSFADWLRLVLTFAVYNAVTWYLLYLFFEDARRYVDLGTVFLACDMWMFSVAVFYTGAERSWMSSCRCSASSIRPGRRSGVRWRLPTSRRSVTPWCCSMSWCGSIAASTGRRKWPS